MTGPAAHPAQARALSRPQQDTQGAHEEVRRSVHPELQKLEAILKYPIMSLFLDEAAGLPSRFLLFPVAAAGARPGGANSVAR
jgi:hypothetical protein